MESGSSGRDTAKRCRRRNVEIARRLFEGWQSGDFLQGDDRFDENVEFVDTGIPDPRTYRGIDATAR
jgi:ketosteroid isomerase-like protein